MAASRDVTNGGIQGPSGGRRIWQVGVALLLGFVLLTMVVNAASAIDEFQRVGHPKPAWMPWTWEASSAVGWLAVMPLTALAAIRLRPPRLSWLAALAVHAALTVPISLAHVGVMVAIRKVVHALMDDWYRLVPSVPDALLYEWRKDVVHYAAMAVAFAAIDWLAKRADREAAEQSAPPARIEVRDGSRTIWLAPGDILWAQAAGNYVELFTSAGTFLHRTSLTAIERELAPYGFARIHRSRLVRHELVRAVETNTSGDFEVILTNGSRIGGSRRYRSALDGW